ncbi:MAG: transglutaminase-like cysteine peptidase [Alphaproteobacteria bacterium]|nr:transglutaminase-like cysteine peptidase [Alphaproteobacteria bacterium]
MMRLNHLIIGAIVAGYLVCAGSAAYAYGLFSGADENERQHLFNSSLDSISYELDEFPKWTGVMARQQSDSVNAGSACSSGTGGACAYVKWIRRMQGLSGQSPMATLQAVNQSVNAIPYGFDQKLWGKSDYWATPLEFFSKRSGDCEDYAIAKYYGLAAAGIPTDNMRVVILKDMRLQILHAVLAVYVDGTAYILDNRNSDVKPSTLISHYHPIYSINEKAWWRHQA